MSDLILFLRRSHDTSGKIGGLLDEFEWTGKIEDIVDRVQMIEMRRLSELHKRQPVAGVIRIQQIAGKRQQLAAVFGQPVVVERIEFL